MKRDGRSFDHRTLEAIRLMAVERVRDGERPSSVVAAFGFNRTTIYKWLTAASQPGVGLRALRSKPATGRPRSLTPRQEQQVFRWILREQFANRRHAQPHLEFLLDGGEPFAAPLLDRLRIALIGSLQRLLRCQSQLANERLKSCHVQPFSPAIRESASLILVCRS